MRLHLGGRKFMGASIPVNFFLEYPLKRSSRAPFARSTWNFCWWSLNGIAWTYKTTWIFLATYDQPSQLKITEKFWCILTRRTFQKGLGNKHLKVRRNVNKKILGPNRKLLKLCYENVHFKLFREISWALANDFNRLIHSVGLFVLYCPISDAKSCLS